ncbi:outer membrane protein assembly factor BamD [Namhaeicola litoreus]|uniref:Outer membrane protein assembly factor BamD n=1 Tax=Namhaeicola litoreus TaxID=1052145 RepID=A0ABW3Y3Q1_9FLAO
MQKMYKSWYVLVLSITLMSCSEYHKVLNKGDNADKYKMAEEMYDAGEYKKSIPLFEKLVGPYGGKPQLERIQYMLADAYYQTGNYELSSYYFGKFIANYPGSSKIEEAAYLSAHSYYLAAPKYSRDQTDTNKALEAFQTYITNYPESERVADANKYYQELNARLEKKDFEIAHQYYHTEHYNAAMTAFDIFNEEHLGSSYKEEAMYFRFKAAHDLAVKSVLSKKSERLQEAKNSYDKFIKNFPESERLKEMNGLMEEVQRAEAELNEQIRAIESQSNS